MMFLIVAERNAKDRSDELRTMLLVDRSTVDDTPQLEHGRQPFSILRMSKLFIR